MAWTEEPDIVNGFSTKFSVIVVELKHHISNFFRDKRRVRAFTTTSSSSSSSSGGGGGGGSAGGGSIVASVQFASPFPQDLWNASVPPFSVEHSHSANKRVRIVHVKDFALQFERLDDKQVTHLEAACEDPSETTVLVMSDETCRRGDRPPLGLPPACWSNVVRMFPFNTPRPEGTPEAPYAPLGPRDTFPFVTRGKRRPASDRRFFLNLKVSPDTSARRAKVIEYTARYQELHPGVQLATSGERIDARQWQDLLLDSKFTISPAGRNPETFRTWEALEAGSIPIVSKRDFTHPSTGDMSDHTCGVGDIAWNTVAASPFARQVSVDSWDELPALLDRLQHESDDYINKLQEECILWYELAMKQSYFSLLNFGQGHDLFPQEGPLFEDHHSA
eukprot:g11759.t1